MTAIVAGIMVIVTAAVMYPFWPDRAFAGPLWSSLIMGGAGLFAVLLGVWWKLNESSHNDLT